MFMTGLFGGLASHYFFPVQSVHAEPRILQADQLWIYAQDGKYRLQMGTYPSAGEEGQPLIGLSDASEHIRLLLRLAGPDASPLLIFKDKNGSDKMVIGLNYSGADETPFIHYTDAQGNPHSLLENK